VALSVIASNGSRIPAKSHAELRHACGTPQQCGAVTGPKVPAMRSRTAAKSLICNIIDRLTAHG
jgi:hypothetical protein